MKTQLLSMLQVFDKEYDNNLTFFDLLDNGDCNKLLKLLKQHKKDGFSFLKKSIKAPNEINLLKKEPLLEEVNIFNDLPCNAEGSIETTKNYIPDILMPRDKKTTFYGHFLRSYFNAIISYINLLFDHFPKTGEEQLLLAVEKLNDYVSENNNYFIHQDENRQLSHYLNICIYYTCIQLTKSTDSFFEDKEDILSTLQLKTMLSNDITRKWRKELNAIISNETKNTPSSSINTELSDPFNEARHFIIQANSLFNISLIPEAKTGGIKAQTRTTLSNPSNMNHLLLSTAKQFNFNFAQATLFSTLSDSDCRTLLEKDLRSNKNSPAIFCKATADALSTANITVNKDTLEELKYLSTVKTVATPLPQMYDFVDKKSEFFVYLTYNYFSCIISHLQHLYENSDPDIAYNSLYTFMKSLDVFIEEKSPDYDGDKPDIIIKKYFALCLYATHSIISNIHSENIDFPILTTTEIEYKLTPGYEYNIPGLPKVSTSFRQYKQEHPELFYSESSTITTEEKITPLQSKNTDSKFTERKEDIREPKKGIPLYKDIIKNPKRFASFEQHLYEEKYIDSSHSFFGKHGTLNEMGMLIHILIERNFFKGFDDTIKKKITPKMIEKFISHRYNADFNKQFRNYNNKATQIAEFEEKTLWLKKIPSC